MNDNPANSEYGKGGGSQRVLLRNLVSYMVYLDFDNPAEGGETWQKLFRKRGYDLKVGKRMKGMETWVLLQTIYA